MKNKNDCISFLDLYLKYYYADIKKEYKLNKKQYQKYCKDKSAKLSPEDFNVIKEHTLEEYFDKYYRELSKGKILIHSQDELFLLNKKRKYWEIPNKTEAYYFEAPPPQNKFILPLILLFLVIAGVSTGGYFIYRAFNPGGGGGDTPVEKGTPLTFTCTDDGVANEASIELCVINNDEPETRNLKYRINEGDWKPIKDADADGNFTIPTTDGEYISILQEGEVLLEGDKIQFKGDNDCFSRSDEISDIFLTFSTRSDEYPDTTFDLSGNIMSLISHNDVFSDISTIAEPGCFSYLFGQMQLGLFNQNIVNAKELSLPAKTLSDYCYQYMFYGCTGLMTAPELPATNLASYCYYNMFGGCPFENAPELPATTLAEGCYSYMFYLCPGIKVAPELNVLDLTGADNCYAGMFSGCASLEAAPELNAMDLSYRCYDHMFAGCPFETAPELPATNLADYCYASMFEQCSNLKNAPELPATNLKERCYASMFILCEALETAPELNATNLAVGCYGTMFNGCISLENFQDELPADVLEEECYKGMFSGCEALETAPELNATNLADYCYANMFEQCSNLKNAPELLPATTLKENCYESMFSGCSALEIAPELPAATLVKGCYSTMFTNCTNLKYVKVGFGSTGSADWPTATYCTNTWLQGAGTQAQGQKEFYWEGSNAGPASRSGNTVPSGWVINPE